MKFYYRCFVSKSSVHNYYHIPAAKKFIKISHLFLKIDSRLILISYYRCIMKLMKSGVGQFGFTLKNNNNNFSREFHLDVSQLKHGVNLPKP